MSWKKNAFSYLMWFVYTIMTGGILMSAAGAFCTGRNIAVYWGVLFAVIVFLAAGGVVFLLHFCSGKLLDFTGRNRTAFHLLEAVMVIGFIAAGIIVRVQGIEGAEETSAYYEAAKVVSGQRIPQIVHGAIFLYVHMLHLGFILLGNYFAAAIGIQIFLQIAALLILFFTVRKLFGSAAALVVLGFGTCAPYMVRNALVLSPDTLFLLIMTVSAALLTGRGFRKEDRKPLLFLPAGILSAFCAYIDVGGILLLILIIAVIFCSGSSSEDGRQKIWALFFVFSGAVIGFLIMTGMDAFLSGKSLEGVMEAWISLYCPETFRLPVVADTAGSWEEGLVLLILMVFGVFSFWCDREKERITVWLTGVCIVIAAECYGIFTKEMPGYLYLYLLFVLVAGIGLEQCFKRSVDGGKYAESEQQAGMQAGLEESKLAGGQDSGELEILELFGKGKPGRAERSGISGGENPGTVEKSGISGGKPGTEERSGISGGENPGTAEKSGISEGEKRGKSGAIREDKRVREHRDLTESTVEESPVKKPVKYIENPLPLPKKHQKRVLDYPERPACGNDDYDLQVSEEDDFDI